MAQREPKADKRQYMVVREDLAAGAVRRVYLFHGDEAFLMRRFAEAVSKAVLAPGAESVDRAVLDPQGRPSSLDLRRLASELATPPFLSPRRLVLVRNSGLFGSERRGAAKDAPAADEPEEGEEEDSEAPAAAREKPDELVRLLDGIPDSACLVFLEKKIDRRIKKPLEAVERNGRIVEFAIQDIQDLRVFISRDLATAGLSIDADAVESLLVRCESSMGALSTECEKLRLRCTGDGTTRVTAAIVEETCIPDLAGRIFDLTDAIGLGKPGEALRILDTLVARKEPVLVLLFMLARHVRLLIRAKEVPSAKYLPAALGLPPFIAGRYADQARGFSMEALEALHAKCFEADAAAKTGRLEERAALEALIASVPPRGAARRP